MTPRVRSWLIDAVIAMVLAVSAAAIALAYIHAEPRRSYFFDWELVPATVMACGHGFSQPQQPLAELTEFVARRSTAFDCAVLAAAPPVVPAAGLPMANRYGLYGPALAMSLGGVSWATLDRYLATMFGLSMALTYALLRLVSMRGLAVVGTLVLAGSNKLQEALGHRDFIKEPPFLALLVVIAWLVVRERSRREAWVGAVAGGLLLGIGIGCRADLIVVGPFFAAALLVFTHWSPGHGGIRNRIVALALFLASFAVTGTPILRTISGGSNLSHTVLLGFMTPFTEHLGLKVPAYDVGSIYSDGYAYTLIAEQARIRERDLGPVLFGEPSYDRAGGRLLVDIARQFPADMLVRGYGAVIEALDYPLSHQAIYESRALAGFAASPVLSTFAAWRYRAFELAEDHGAWIGVAALVVAAAINLRLALFGTFVVFYFCAYSMLQFSRRHTFHLDVFTVAAAMFLLTAALTLLRQLTGRDTRAALRPRSWAINIALYVAIAGVVIAGPLVVLRWYQQAHVRDLLDTTLAETATVVPLTTTPAGNGVLVSSVALGERHGPGPIDDVRDVRMDYVVTEFSGAACGAAPFQVRTVYTGVAKTFDKEFNREHTVTPPPDGAAFRLLSPLFYEYGPYWLRFDGFVVPDAQAGCLTSVRRAEHPGDLPFPFLFAALEPNWRDGALYQRFRWE